MTLMSFRTKRRDDKTFAIGFNKTGTKPVETSRNAAMIAGVFAALGIPQAEWGRDDAA